MGDLLEDEIDTETLSLVRCHTPRRAARQVMMNVMIRI
jgi:hypothetical protein